MAALGGEAADHHFGRTGRHELSGSELEALDRERRGEVEVAVAQHDAGGAAGAEPLLLIHRAVAVGVAQPHQVSGLHRLARGARAGADRDVEVAVGGHRQVAGVAQVVGDDLRTEAGRQRQAAVPGVARGRRRRTLAVHHGPGGDRPEQGQECGHAVGHDESFRHRRPNSDDLLIIDRGRPRDRSPRGAVEPQPLDKSPEARVAPVAGQLRCAE